MTSRLTSQKPSTEGPLEGRCLEGHLQPPVAGNSRVKILLAQQLVTRYAVTRYIKSYLYGAGS
jgi:hypothetical protein